LRDKRRDAKKKGAILAKNPKTARNDNDSRLTCFDDFR
jgi:hypothetical protein